MAVIGFLLFLQFSGMVLANVLELLDRFSGIAWLYPMGSRPRVQWRLPHFFVAWLMVVLLQSGLYVFFGLIFESLNLDGKSSQAMLSVSAANVLLILMIILIAGPGWSMGLRRFGLMGPEIGRQWLIGFRAALLISPWVYLVNFIANKIFHSTPHEVMKMLDQDLNSLTAVLAGVSAVVFAPLAEEILFRGMLLGALIRKAKVRPATERKLPVQMANVATSLFFALLHANAWPAPIGIFVLSLFLGKLYITTGRLWPCIAAHAMFNMTGVLGMLMAALTKESGLIQGF